MIKKSLMLLPILLIGCQQQPSLEEKYTVDVNPYNEDANSPMIEEMSSVQRALDKMTRHLYASTESYSFTKKAEPVSLRSQYIEVKRAPKAPIKIEGLEPVIKKNALHMPIIETQSKGIHIPGE